MKNKTPELTNNEAMQFLTQLLNRIDAQDNYGTRKPVYFALQDIIEVSTTGDDSYDEVSYRKDGDEVGADCDPDYTIYVKHIYTTRNVFFTEEEAERYMKQNMHNLKKPRVWCGYWGDNNEVKELLDAIRIIIGKAGNNEKR